MQVCAMQDCTDDEILSVCNRENPSGTTLGWTQVVRKNTEERSGIAPVNCGEIEGRVHFLVAC